MLWWSNISLVLQIAIVIAAVVLFSIFDPFGILNTKKQSLEDTPISVQSMREIGQLISAEYYGEVLTSLQEALIEEMVPSELYPEVEMNELWNQFVIAIDDMRSQQDSLKKVIGVLNRGQKLMDIFYENYELPSAHPYYQPFIKMLAKNDKEEQKLLRELFLAKNTKIEQKIKDLGEERKLATFKANIKELLDVKTANKKFRKSQIVVLGRGWVKAGINFQSFNESNFKYDKQNKIIHLVGMKPEILMSTINPWFIPERQVKGFEVVVMTKKARKPEYMQKVKQRSLEKLRQNAIRAGIIEQAKTNAEVNLKNFFSLLVPDGIDKVIIHVDFFSYFDTSFMTDKLNPEIMRSIDSLLAYQYREDSAAVMSMRYSLEEKKVYLNNQAFPINRYSSRLNMAQDEILSPADIEWIEKERDTLNLVINKLEGANQIDSLLTFPNRLDSIWLYPSQATLEQFIAEADDSVKKTIPKIKLFSSMTKKQELIERKVLLYMAEKKKIQLDALNKTLLNHVTQIAKGDTTFILKTKKPNVEASIPGVEYVDNFNDDLLAMEENEIHLWNLQEQMQASFDTLQKANNHMVKDWYIDREYVLEVRDTISNTWRLSFDTALIISRYSMLYQYIDGKTLSEQGLIEILDEQKAFYRSDSIVDNSDDEKILLINETIDKVWFQPPSDSISLYKKEASNINHDFFTPVKKRKKIRARYIQNRSRKSILNSRKQEFESVVKDIILRIDTITTTNKNYIKQGDEFRNLPDSITFLQNYLGAVN